MEKLKEEIADLLHRHYYPTMHEAVADTTLFDCTDKILTLFQDWLKKEIGELKVIGDEEIRFLRDAADIQENKLLLGNTTILAEKAVAQAQLDAVKKHFEEMK